MKKAWSIFLSVLLGALVVGIGTGYFLHLANKDRERLADEAMQAKQTAQQALEDRQRAVDEANAKLDEANQEVNKAQFTLQSMRLERDLLVKARPLSALPRSQSWPTAISTGLALSVRFPAGNAVTANDIYGLTVAASGTRMVNATATQPWLSVTPFDQKMREQYEARLASSTEVTYFVNGKILNGVSGILQDSNNISAAALSILTDGTSTQLIWIQDPPKNDTRKKNSAVESWIDIIATLDFKK